MMFAFLEFNKKMMDIQISVEVMPYFLESTDRFEVLS